MVGRLRTSFRSGNLAENLGVLLLKGVAAVAEVAPAEDIGLDAVATLLRRDADGNCYAEDTFVVQLKAASVTSIEYPSHSLQWLVGQTQPMFIGRVSLRDASISLYPTITANQALGALGAAGLTLRFGVSPHGQPWNGNDDGTATVWLERPLLRWDVADLSKVTWAQSAYETLKHFLSLVRKEFVLISLGTFSKLSWETNQANSIEQAFMMLLQQSDALQDLAEKASPILRALAMEVGPRELALAKDVVASIIALKNSLRPLGVDVDREGILDVIANAISHRGENDPISCPAKQDL